MTCLVTERAQTRAVGLTRVRVKTTTTPSMMSCLVKVRARTRAVGVKKVIRPNLQRRLTLVSRRRGEMRGGAGISSRGRTRWMTLPRRSRAR